MSKKDKYKVAMVGATGAVGETLLAILAERKCPISELVPLASERSAGGQVVVGNNSVTGRSGAEELARQTASLLNFQEYPPSKFSKQIAFNVIPHIDEFQANGYTKEEMKMVWETQKILEDKSIQVNPTAVRVPVFYGHSEAVHIELREKATADEVRALLETAPGLKVIDERKAGGY